jgi:hypothetical protein
LGDEYNAGGGSYERPDETKNNRRRLLDGTQADGLDSAQEMLIAADKY